MPFSVIKITRTLLAREDHFLELHNVQHGEKDPVDGGTPTLMKVPVVPMRDREMKGGKIKIWAKQDM